MNWALIGVGYIAEKFMDSLRYVEDARVVAACGRNSGKVNAFCDKWGIPGRYTDSRELYEREAVDLVYLATPHIVHYPFAMEAIRCGKNVLCEKPMAMTAEETRQIAEAAREKGVFLMEAMWSRFFPASEWLRGFLREGSLGMPLNVNAEFAFAYPYDPNYRFFRKDLGGGCLRGAGIYPIQMALSVFHSYPDRLAAFCEMKNDVDVRTTAILQFQGERRPTAQLLTGFQCQSHCMADIAFEKGSILIPDFISPSSVYIMRHPGVPIEEKKFPFEGIGLQFEIRHAMECVREGRKESDIMPLEESIACAHITDEIYEELERS